VLLIVVRNLPIFIYLHGGRNKISSKWKFILVSLTVIAVAATPDDERNYVLEGGERGCSNFWWFNPAT
jgi:hypothetical protein